MKLYYGVFQFSWLDQTLLFVLWEYLAVFLFYHFRRLWVVLLVWSFVSTSSLSLELRPSSSTSRKEEGIKSSHLPSPTPRACPEVCAQWFPSTSQPNPRDSAVWVPNKTGLCKDKNKERGRGAGSYYLVGTEFRFYKKSSGADGSTHCEVYCH